MAEVAMYTAKQRNDGAVVVSQGFVGFCNGVTPPAFIRPEL